MVSKRPTLRDIAHYANVSVSTVSRALNNYQHVDEATRAAVQQAVEVLQYPLGNLRSPRSAPMISVLSRNPQGLASSNVGGGNFEYLAMLGVRRELEPRHLNLQVRRIWIDSEDLDTIRDDSGVIVLGGMVDYPFVQRLSESGIPFVMLGSHVLPLQTNCVMANYAHGMRQAVDHLVERGRCKIGLVNGPSTTRTSIEKLNSLQLGLLQHGLQLPPASITAADFRSEDGYVRTHELLERSPDVNAIIYTDDNTAIGGMSAIKETGRTIPADVAVIGFHDYDISRFTDPPLTTVHFDMMLMGKMAARRLVMLLDDANDRENWMMLAPTELIIRSST
ncbi:MAG: LacI family transcriptional regulator [Anaerolineae bacterium]|nr:LacI family transcriptional regulator [Anaerolineae bacterium]